MKEIISRLIKFRDERNWSQFHTPKNLAKSIIIEAAELLENFQFEDQEDVNNIKDEIADIMGYCLLMSEHYGLILKRLSTIKWIKMKRNIRLIKLLIPLKNIIYYR